MIKKLKHYAVIPAREGSVGFPKKNQLFFDNTASFLKKLSWINKVIVSSDDPILLEKAKSLKFTPYKRSLALSGSDISIKLVFNDLILIRGLKSFIQIQFLSFSKFIYINLSILN